MEQVGPAVARRRVRERLRALREQCGFAPSEVARAMDWSLSKLNRIENGVVTIQPVEVRALLNHYNVDSSDPDVSALVGFAKISRAQKWWNSKGLSKDFQEFVAYEDEASGIYNYQALFVPALLQTPDYAQHITAWALNTTPDDLRVQKIVEVRLERQEHFEQRRKSDYPPKLVAAVDESVLLRPVGGVAVLRRQLDHLIVKAGEATTELIVVPLRLDGHPGLGGTFELLEFAESEDPDVLFVESASREWIETNPTITAHYRDTMGVLGRLGWTGETAVQAIGGIRDSFSK